MTVSSTRSRMIVAKAAVALSPSLRASRYGRMTSPARAGSRKLAAKPITVARKAVLKRAGPMASSRKRQRKDLRTYVKPVMSTAATRSSGRARCVSAHTPAIFAFRRKNASSPNVNRQISSVRVRGRMPWRVEIEYPQL